MSDIERPGQIPALPRGNVVDSGQPPGLSDPSVCPQSSYLSLGSSEGRRR